MKRKRVQILMQRPDLANSRELSKFMLEGGEVRSVHEMPREDTELGENEPLWSESEDEDSDDLDEGGEFKTLDRLNTSSHDKLDRLQSLE